MALYSGTLPNVRGGLSSPSGIGVVVRPVQSRAGGLHPRHEGAEIFPVVLGLHLPFAVGHEFQIVDAPVEMDHVPLFGAEPPLNADGDVLRQAAVRRDTMGVGLVLMLSNLEVRPAPVMPLRGAKLLRSNVQRLTSNEDAAERLYCEWPCSRCARARPCCASKPTPAPAKAYGTLGAHAPSPISDAKPMRSRRRESSEEVSLQISFAEKKPQP